MGMDTAQLQLILDMVGQVSGDAVTIAVAFIVLDKVLPFILIMALFYVVYRIALLIYRACTGEVQPIDSKDAFWKEMRDCLGIGAPGHLTSDEASRTEAALRRLAKASRAGK